MASKRYTPDDLDAGLIDLMDVAPGGGFGGGLVISGFRPSSVDYGVQFGPPMPGAGADPRLVIVAVVIAGLIFWKLA